MTSIRSAAWFGFECMARIYVFEAIAWHWVLSYIELLDPHDNPIEHAACNH